MHHLCKSFKSYKISYTFYDKGVGGQVKDDAWLRQEG
jgi:hypothetical protein